MDLRVSLSVIENGRTKPDYDIQSDLNGEVSLAELARFVKISLIEISKNALAEELNRGFDKNYQTFVDGQKNKAIEEVNAFGKISFVARVDFSKILIELFKGVWERSKVVTGAYKDSHRLLFNGNQIGRTPEDAANWFNNPPKIRNGDTFILVNIQPYARKLERLGVTADRTSTRSVKSRDHRQRSGPKILAPNGAYFLTYRSVNRKYKFNSNIKFTFISGSRFGLAGGFKTATVRDKFGKSKTFKLQKARHSYLYPAIVIKVEEGGIL